MAKVNFKKMYLISTEKFDSLNSLSEHNKTKHTCTQHFSDENKIPPLNDNKASETQYQHSKDTSLLREEDVKNKYTSKFNPIRIDKSTQTDPFPDSPKPTPNSKIFSRKKYRKVFVRESNKIDKNPYTKKNCINPAKCNQRNSSTMKEGCPAKRSSILMKTEVPSRKRKFEQDTQIYCNQNKNVIKSDRSSEKTSNYSNAKWLKI